MKIIDVDAIDFMDLLVEPLKGKEAPELTDEMRERMRKPMTWEYNGWKEDEFSNDKDKEAGISREGF